MRKIEEILDQYAGRVNRKLETCLPDESSPPETLHQAMRYAVLGNGKRIRPVLLYATGEALGVPSERLDNPACAVELIHSYSLVHDDLPAMDDDDLRRGRPTCHKAFDEATAILVGDAVQALAFSMLANDQANSPEQRNTMIQLLAECTGSQGMVGGQAIDLASVDRQLSRQEVERMHRLKTGALIKASVLLAVIASGADDPDTHNHFARFAECIGLMFQIRDDILDIQSNTETLGKPQGSDEAQKKPTYPSIIGIEESESACRELLEQACLEMESVNVRWDTLKLISRYIVTRAS